MFHGRAYGSRSLQDARKAQGIGVGRFRARHLMRQHQLRPTWKRTFIHTTDSKHDLPLEALLECHPQMHGWLVMG